MEAVQAENKEDKAKKNINLFRGYKRFEEVSKDLEGIFDKLEGIVDVFEYIDRYKAIVEKVDKLKLSGKMTNEDLQLDYEDYYIDEYYGELEKIREDIINNITPFYELYKSAEDIDEMLLKGYKADIKEIILLTKILIDGINWLNTHNEKKRTSVINRAYETVYRVLLFEESFDRDDIFKYIKNANITVNIENIGRLLSKDLDKIDKNKLRKLELDKLKDEGLGYDFFDRDIFKKVSRKQFGEINHEFQRGKEDTFRKLVEREYRNNENLKSQEAQLKDKQRELEKLRKKEGRAYRSTCIKGLSLFLVPALIIPAGYSLGEKVSGSVKEYRNITRTVDYDTGAVTIIEDKYDEKPVKYSATLTKNEPWQINKAGGFVRNVIVYEYDPTANYSNLEGALGKTLREKYRYTETKRDLTEKDLTDETTILITEKYSEDAREISSNRFVIPYTLGASIISILIDLAIIVFGLLGKSNGQLIIDKLIDDIQKNKLKEEEIIERIKKCKEEALKIEEERREAILKYGSVDDKFVNDEIRRIKDRDDAQNYDSVSELFLNPSREYRGLY